MRVNSSWLRNIVAILLVGSLLAATLYVFFARVEGQRQEIEKGLSQSAAELTVDLETHMQTYMDALSAVGRFIVASDEFSFSQFELFTREYIEKYPGIHALSWNSQVESENLLTHEKEVREQGFAEYQVKQRFALGKVGPVAERAIYYPVTFITPFADNKTAHGHDTYAPDAVAGNVRQKVLDQARDEGVAITTGRITLVQLENQFGLLVYKPVYSKSMVADTLESRKDYLIGFVAAVFIVPELFKDTAQQAEKNGLSIVLRDISMPEGKQFLYHSHTPNNQEPDANSQHNNNSLFTKKIFEVAGHQWQIGFEETDLKSVEKPWHVLLIGFVFSFVIGAAVFAYFKLSDSHNQSSASKKDKLLDFAGMAGFVFLLGVLISIIMTLSFRDIQKTRMRQLMDIDARTQFQALQRHIDESLELVELTKSYFHTSTNVTRDEFRRFVSPLLNKSASAQALAWVPRVDEAERRSLELGGASESLGGYVVKQKEGESLVRAPYRSEHFPVLYVEPSEANNIVLGFDLASEPTRAAILDEARNDGKTHASGIVTLIQESEPQKGILVFSPVYENGIHYKNEIDRREKISGFVLMALSIPDIYSDFLAGRAENSRVLVVDITNPGSATAVFETNPDESASISEYEFSGILEFAARQWLVKIKPSQVQYQHQITELPWVVLISGLLITALLSLIVLQLSRRRLLVEGLVDERTAQLEEIQSFQKLMISTIPDYVSVVDSEFKLVNANPSFLSLYPVHLQGSLLGSDIRKVDNPNQIEGLAIDQLDFKDEKVESYEKYSFVDRKIHTFVKTCVKFQDKNSDEFILSVSRDVTEREKLLQQLTLSNEELDEFAYIASHDLKEPLRGINNHASIFLRKSEDTLDEDGARRINRIMELTKYMELLVSDLLYFSRVGRSDIALQPVDLNLLVKSIVDSMALEEDAEAVITVSESLPTIVCDKTRIGEVFRNLMVNGLKYNESKPKIVKVGLEEKFLDGMLQKVFFVKDNGIGIDADFHHEIFRIFKRLHKKSAYGGGTGSGLTFVKKIVERHEGKVWVESVLGKGSVFYFTLPNAWSNLEGSRLKGDL